MSIFILVTMIGCASNTNHMRVSEDQKFALRQHAVCEHFQTSSSPMKLNMGLQGFYVNNQERTAPAILVVETKNLPAWHCGQTEWEVSNENVADLPALGKEVPKFKI